MNQPNKYKITLIRKKKTNSKGGVNKSLLYNKNQVGEKTGLEHNHINKPLLDSLFIDNQGFVVRRIQDGENIITKRLSDGGHALSSDSADEANTADSLKGMADNFYKDNQGVHAVIDTIEVKGLAIFKEMQIARLTYVGGMNILTPAGMICSAVQELDDVYRCFFDLNGGKVVQEFTVGSQANCQIFKGSLQKFYWRLVTAIGTDYIDLSKTDALANSAIPEVGDSIVQLGHRSDDSRKGALFISAIGDNNIVQYNDIDSYSLPDNKRRFSIGASNYFKGDLYLNDGRSILQVSQDTIRLALKKGGVNMIPSSESIVIRDNGTEWQQVVITPIIDFKPNTTYTLSVQGFDYQGHSTLFSYHVYKVEGAVGGLNAHGNAAIQNGIITTFTTNEKAGPGFKFLLYNGKSGETAGNEIKYIKVKLEEGEYATPWTAAPSDIEKKLLSTGINIKDRKIEATADNFLIKANDGTPIAVFKLDENGNPVLKVDHVDLKTLFGVTGTFSGSIRTVMKAINLSDANITPTSTGNAYKLVNNLNVITGYHRRTIPADVACEVILPSDISYNGAMVTIIDDYFNAQHQHPGEAKSVTRAGWGTLVRAETNSGILVNAEIYSAYVDSVRVLAESARFIAFSNALGDAVMWCKL